MKPEDIFALSNDPLLIGNLLINLLIGFALAVALAQHFKMYSSTLSNRDEFVLVFPFVLLTTLLIISIVKSSLALSLGLVGALSIVRFRTPIKEPEELAYLFLAISMGLGLGANQTIATLVGGISIMVLVTIFKRSNKDNKGKNIYLSIDMKDIDDDSKDYLNRINAIISKHTIGSDLRRYDVRSGLLEATYFIDLPSMENLSSLMDDLKLEYPEAGFSFLDQNQLPSI